MEHLTNAYDHRLPDAMKSFEMERYSYGFGWTWLEYNMWLSDKIIGRPQATKYYSVEELEKMGLIGIYSK